MSVHTPKLLASALAVALLIPVAATVHGQSKLEKVLNPKMGTFYIAAPTADSQAEGARFRILLETALKQHGFELADTAEHADNACEEILVIRTGSSGVGNIEDVETEAAVTLIIKSPIHDNKVLFTEDFTSRNGVSGVAESIAASLSKRMQQVNAAECKKKTTVCVKP